MKSCSTAHPHSPCCDWSPWALGEGLRGAQYTSWWPVVWSFWSWHLWPFIIMMFVLYWCVPLKTRIIWLYTDLKDAFKNNTNIITCRHYIFYGIIISNSCIVWELEPWGQNRHWSYDATSKYGISAMVIAAKEVGAPVKRVHGRGIWLGVRKSFYKVIKASKWSF